MKEIKKDERLKFFTALFLGVPLLIAFFSGLAGITPAKKFTYNFTAMYIALGLNIAYWSCGLAYRFSDKKTLWSWVCLYIFAATWMPALMGIPFLNLIYVSFPTWVVIAPLGAMYVVAALLPFINDKLSETLHTEMFAPRSCLGRVLLIVFLALAPIAGVFGVFLSNLAERIGNGMIGYAMFGLLFHLFFVWAEVTMVYQAWEHRPWARGKKR